MKREKYENEEYELKCFFIAERPAALCVTKTDDEGEEEIWLPKYDRDGNRLISFQRRGHIVTLFAPEWLLVEKGLV